MTSPCDRYNAHFHSLPRLAETVDRGETDELSTEAAARVIENAELAALSGQRAGCVSLWLTEALSESVDVKTDLSVRLRTAGDSPFIGG